MTASAAEHVPSGAPWDASALAALTERCAALGCATAREEPLGRHTSMGVGGPTPLMVWPQHPQAVGEILAWCADRGLGWRILGGGTNVLVSDAGVAEPVISTTSLIDGSRLAQPVALFSAGTPTAQALRATVRAGLAGLVWSTGLPGTIGGAAAGNAGCWGGSMADVVTRLDVVDAAGDWHEVDAAEVDWSYRRLNLPESLGSGAAIVSVSVRVHEDDPDALAGRSDELHRQKRDSQPVGARNAGCIFKNPDAEHPAGLLIDRAGCKGVSVGGAQISEVHGNFLINRGGATSAHVDALIGRVKRAVREHSGMALEEEIRRW